MPNSDQNYLRLHKKVYKQLLDELDNEVIAEVMADPDCDEAVALNVRVEARIKEILADQEAVCACLVAKSEL